MGPDPLDDRGRGDPFSRAARPGDRGAKPEQSAQLADTIERADGFAEDKYNIVDALQRRGHIVGMTGDGVNDAPPLKKADAGIAVSGATDAARAAADIVLLAAGLSAIIEGFTESRRVFRRMNSYTIYRVAETAALVFFLTLSIIVFNFYPVTPIMIVLLAVLNDGAILSIAYDRTGYANTPERWNLRLVLGIATVLGIYGLAESFAFLYLARTLLHVNLDIIRSLIYLQLSVSGHLTIFVTRTRGHFWSVLPARILVLAVVGTQFVATLIAVYGLLIPSIGWTLALIAWAYYCNDTSGYRLEIGLCGRCDAGRLSSGADLQSVAPNLRAGSSTRRV